MPPEMPDVATLTVISKDWGNDIRSRTVQRYSSVANRTTLHPSPTEGDLAYMADSNEVHFYNGTSWVVVGPVADGSITAAKIATNTITNAEIGPDAVTSSELADSAVTVSKLASTVASNLMAADGGVNTSSSALTASFVHKASVNFTKPASWATYRIIAWGATTMGGLSAGAGPQARVEIGGSTGSTFSYSPTTNEVSISCFNVVAAASSSPVTIATACRAASGTGNHLISYVAFTAYRLT